MKSIEEQSRYAWNVVRSEHQPVYDDLEQSYRERLHERAQNVNTLRRPGDEGGIFQQFEQVVLEELIPERFHQPSPEPPAEVKAELVAEVIKESKPNVPKPKKPAPKEHPKTARVVKTAKKLAEKKSTQKGAKKR